MPCSKKIFCTDAFRQVVPKTASMILCWRTASGRLLLICWASSKMYYPNNAIVPAARHVANNLSQRAETDFFSGEPLRALSTLVYSDNIDLQRSASLTFAEITERGTQTMTM